MPTMARLVAALLLAATGYAASEIYYPVLPEGTPATWMSETIAALGLVIGWRAIGRDAEDGDGVIALAVKAGVYLVFWTLTVFSIREMLLQSTGRRYHGPFDAILDIPAIGWEFLVSAMVPSVLGALVIGAFVTAAASRGTARYFA